MLAVNFLGLTCAGRVGSMSGSTALAPSAVENRPKRVKPGRHFLYLYFVLYESPSFFSRFFTLHKTTQYFMAADARGRGARCFEAIPRALQSRP